MSNQSLGGSHEGDRTPRGDEPGIEPPEPGGVDREVASSRASRLEASREALLLSPMLGLGVALVAALSVWGTLEIVWPVFRLPEHLRELSGNVGEAEQAEFFAALKVTRERNAVFAMVLLAAGLALALSVAELLQRGAGWRIVWGGLLACLVGGVSAVAAGAGAIALHEALDLEGNRLGKTLLVQAGLMGLIGLGVGLALAVPLFRPRLALNCLAGCLIGGLLAGLVFPIAASFCLPDVNTDELVPHPGPGRLLWAGLACGLIGLAATGLGKRKERQHATAA